jgi:tetratricopeptide (TPR) repeat protein
MFSPFVTEYAGLYQELLSGVASYQRLGNRLIQLAEQAHAFRQFEKVKELGQLLSNIPIKNYQAIGHYFLAVAANSMGNGDQARARELFENVVDTAPQRYKAKALLSLAAISAHKGNFDSELFYFVEGLKASTDLVTTLSAHQGIAIIKAKEGYNKSSLRDLENMESLMRYVPHRNQIVYLNSLAVELGEAGRMDEAECVSRITIASPFAPYYPEWQSTYSEIRSKRKRPRYVQSKAKPDHEISNQQTALEIYDQEIESDTNLLPFRKRQPIHSQPHLYSHIEATGNQYTTRQKRNLIVDIVCNLNEESLDRLFALAMELDEPQARRPRQIDLEEKGTLEEMMNLWTSGDLDPNDHVAVLSALRDCDNNLRRQNIINEMITY